MNFEEIIIIERVFIRRRWTQNGANFPPPNFENNFDNHQNNQQNHNLGQMQNLDQIRLEGEIKVYFNG